MQTTETLLSSLAKFQVITDGTKTCKNIGKTGQLWVIMFANLLNKLYMPNCT